MSELLRHTIDFPERIVSCPLNTHKEIAGVVTRPQRISQDSPVEGGALTRSIAGENVIP